MSIESNPLTFGSVCSGIESASMAWEPLGMSAAWLAEIEPFPAAVLAHHWPHVTNHGDMTTLPSLILRGAIDAPEILVGGTPCQAFSVAGNRESLGDARGQLTLSYVEIANAIDHVRRLARLPECITCWENVPGVLSTKDNAFGCFLAALVGESEPLQPPGDKWPNAGCVYGPERAAAWRILDAQYFGVAQRRRRVFVIASARNGFDPAAVLFESEGVRRDSAPRRKEGQETAGTLASRTGAGGFPGTDEACSGYVQAVHGTQDPCVMSECAFPLGRNQGQENAISISGDIARTLRGEGFDASEDGTVRGTPIVSVAFAENSRAELRLEGGDGQRTGALSTGGGKPGQGVPMIDSAVRRLTPIECERLQGFPDDHTRIGWRNKAPGDCPDGPRYKAIGNSKAVPVVRWIGERIKRAIA